VAEVLGTLRDPNHRVRQPFVNCLLLAYSSGGNLKKLRSSLADTPLLLENIMSILDRAPAILRGKLYLLLAYLFNRGTGSLLHHAAQLRLFTVLSHDMKKPAPDTDETTTEDSEYMLSCASCFLYVIADAVPRWMAGLEATLRVTSQRKRPPLQQIKKLRGHFEVLPGVTDVLANPLIRTCAPNSRIHHFAFSLALSLARRLFCASHSR
jgi:hypothetical protein